MALLGHSHRSPEHQQEVKEAKRLLKERIRSDWDYPPLPAYRSTGNAHKDTSGEERVAGFRFHVQGNHDRNEMEAVEWREREYASESGDGESDAESVRTTSSTTSRKSRKSDYKFEGPDSVGAEMAERLMERKRRRQRKLEDEMTWNAGLAHWTQRRDIWSGARPKLQVSQRQTAGPSMQYEEDSAGSSADSAESTPRTSTSSTERSASSVATTPSSTPPAPATSHPPPPPSSTISPPSSVLVPICPPILPDHPIRRRIIPTMYHEIYNKIILSSRTPSVPINLLTLVSALVAGWKQDGEWPPRAAAVPEASIAKRRPRKDEGGLKGSVKAVGRALGL